MGNIIFITGGARSGKSSFALKKAAEITGRRVYIATARALDEEMKERIQWHKRERPPEWETLEEPLRISNLIKRFVDRYDVLLLDCLTLWLSNLMVDNVLQEKLRDEIEDFIETLKAIKGYKGSHLFIVSNEVGMGIVPENQLARRFRDEAGRLNQMVAEMADDVYLLVSGIPLKIKG